MFLAGFVVQQDTFLQRVLDNFVGYLCPDFFASMTARERSGNLENVVSTASIAARVAGDLLQNLV